MDRLDAFGFDWVLLRSFLAIYRAGGVSAAARMLGESQPTLSRHLMQLEAQLGIRLFERSGRGLRPTVAGATVADSAAQMESIANRLSLALAARDSELVGSVRVAATQLIANNLLPRLAAQLIAAHPGLHIEIVAGDDLPNLLEHEADIVIGTTRPKQLDVVVRQLGSTTVVAVAHADYLARRGTPLLAEELLDHDLIGLDRNDTILCGLQAVGVPVTREHFCFRSDDKNACLRALEAGVGICFISDFLLEDRPQLQRLLPGLPLPTLTLWISVHREGAGNALTRMLFDALSEALQERLRRSS